MFNRIVISACIAGLAAALALTAAQAVWITPLIAQAETYEEAAQVNTSAHEHHAASSQENDNSHHHEDAWQPQDGWQRTLATGISNTVMGVGFALMLCGMYALRQPPNVSQGLRWGLAGYVIFFAAPALGLPPDLPGTAAAELSARQYWWLGTAITTAAGLSLIFLQARKPYKLFGIVMLAIPHVIGAPHPAVLQSLSPEALQTQFRLITIFTNALFWLLLGVLSAAAFKRLGLPSSDHKNNGAAHG